MQELSSIDAMINYSYFSKRRTNGLINLKDFEFLLNDKNIKER